LILSLAGAFCVINVVLAFFGQDDIAIYFIANTCAYLVITLIYVFLNPRGRNALNMISAVVFAGFLVIVTLKVIEILS
jgi:hypothetical protein